MRYRTETRHRQVPHTIDGDTELIDEPYTVHVPLPPRDWDHIALTTVTATTAALVLGSVVWSTTGIGDLLARAAVAPIAYTAAVAFDVVWINCMILEWLARYDPARAATPRRAGHVALALAMGAVCAHGWLEDSFIVGAASAAVSALAKAGWTLTLRAYARPLDPRTQQWLITRQAKAGARLALDAQLRRLARLEAHRTSPDADPDRPDESADSPDADVLPLPPSALTTKDAVRTAWDSGIRDEDQIRRAASKALGRPVSPDTVGRYVRALKVGA